MYSLKFVEWSLQTEGTSHKVVGAPVLSENLKSNHYQFIDGSVQTNVYLL